MPGMLRMGVFKPEDSAPGGLWLPCDRAPGNWGWGACVCVCSVSPLN